MGSGDCADRDGLRQHSARGEAIRQAGRTITGCSTATEHGPHTRPLNLTLSFRPSVVGVPCDRSSSLG
jgi:hypothetical protein